MPIALQIMEMNKEIRNGEVVKDSAVSAEYDGKIIHIDTLANDNMAHYEIKDNHLKKLLEMPASKMDLVERLNRHNKGTKKHQHQRSKHKGTKHQRSKHQRSKHQRSKNKPSKNKPSKNKPSKNKK
jgi:nitrous oxide reductase